VVTQEVICPSFAFICDTSIEILVTFPRIVTFPIVIIECTFLYPEERENARETKHIHWEDLRPYVVANPNTIFVLIHFSLRYKEEEIIQFFRSQREEHPEESYDNLKVWAGDTTKSVWDEISEGDLKFDELREALDLSNIEGNGGCCSGSSHKS
jgi:ribonuclease Z